MLRQAFTKLPIPGRYLAPAISAAGVDLARIPSPIAVRDRWNDFSVEISSPSDIIERHILFQGYFEYRESCFVRSTLGPGKLFVDVGANIGWHSLLAAHQVTATGRVLAFEPATRAFQHLQRNIVLNRFSQIEAFHFGLSSRDATFDIFPCEDENSGANSLYGAGAAIEQVEVRAGDETLDRLEVGTIDLCKIDVEGAELDVLDGLERTFAGRRVKAIMIEVNHESLARAGRSPAELIARLRGHGFALRDVRSGRAIKAPADLESQNIVGEIA